jgi:upstream activation factor subunit UAF30
MSSEHIIEVENENNNENIETLTVEDGINKEFDDICKEVGNIKNSINTLMTRLRNFKKDVDKALRNKDKSIDKTTKPKKPKKEKTEKDSKTEKKKIVSGITKPVILSDDLCNFLGKPLKTEMARTEVTKELYQYIKDNKLQDTENKKIIKADKAMLTMLGVDEGYEITYFNIQNLMNKHYIKQETENEDNNDSE